MTPDGLMTVMVVVTSVTSGLGAVASSLCTTHRDDVKPPPLKPDPEMTDTLGAAGKRPSVDRPPLGYELRKRLYSRRRWMDYLGRLCSREDRAT